MSRLRLILGLEVLLFVPLRQDLMLATNVSALNRYTPMHKPTGKI